MPLVIDAYNLLHAALGAAGGGRDLGLAGLAQLLGRSRYAGQPATLVCDGQRLDLAGERVGGVRVLFAGSGHDADSIIEHLVARDSAPGRLIVVSSDRRVQAAGKRRRCTVMSSETFLTQLLRDAASAQAPAPPSPRERVPLGSSEVAYWVSAFGERAAWAMNIAPSVSSRAEDPGSPGAGREDRTKKKPASKPAEPRAELNGKGNEVEVDSVLEELLERFPRIRRDDLDMARWLGERRGRDSAGPEGSGGPGGR